ncbi:hypothetical protein C8R45DRAFT_1188851 [Mycena sanguinolenta]|nr:hypothetical protein C8R45DRAFT_1188851 [Mycena sanguinolenta]
MRRGRRGEQAPNAVSPDINGSVIDHRHVSLCAEPRRAVFFISWNVRLGRAAIAPPSSSAFGTPARMWSSVPLSRSAPSSPAPNHPEEEGEGELTATQLSRQRLLERSALCSATFKCAASPSKAKDNEEHEAVEDKDDVKRAPSPTRHRRRRAHEGLPARKAAVHGRLNQRRIGGILDVCAVDEMGLDNYKVRLHPLFLRSSSLLHSIASVLFPRFPSPRSLILPRVPRSSSPPSPPHSPLRSVETIHGNNV